VQSAFVQHAEFAMQIAAQRRVPVAQPHVPAVHVSPDAQLLTHAPLEHVWHALALQSAFVVHDGTHAPATHRGIETGQSAKPRQATHCCVVVSQNGVGA
jgi:hypothetical protein